MQYGKRGLRRHTSEESEVEDDAVLTDGGLAQLGEVWPREHGDDGRGVRGAGPVVHHPAEHLAAIIHRRLPRSESARARCTSITSSKRSYASLDHGSTAVQRSCQAQLRAAMGHRDLPTLQALWRQRPTWGDVFAVASWAVSGARAKGAKSRVSGPASGVHRRQSRKRGLQGSARDRWRWASATAAAPRELT